MYNNNLAVVCIVKQEENRFKKNGVEVGIPLDGSRKNAAESNPRCVHRMVCCITLVQRIRPGRQ